ncbi:hypothetical protein MNBD_GAMMA15-1196 [hydrothermal vent metagenome]|uniref:Sel1 repeat family protein n=1 Tax=hydrothermal vent metagenome TaxID=652676 RepID=A0A3B0ZBK2_9ZZZZ
MKRSTFAASMLLATCLYMAAPFTQADFDAGLKAYNELYAYQRAYREFQIEGAQGHREAQFYLGEICEGGVGRPIDYHEAFGWYQDSARQGYGPAQQRLARLYRNGRGVEKNLQMAFAWQKKAARQGQVVAQYRLGHYYSQGIGTRKEPVLAYTWWTIAASRGDPDAMSELEKLSKTLSRHNIGKAMVLVRQWEESFYKNPDLMK